MKGTIENSFLSIHEIACSGANVGLQRRETCCSPSEGFSLGTRVWNNMVRKIVKGGVTRPVKLVHFVPGSLDPMHGEDYSIPRNSSQRLLRSHFVLFPLHVYAI